jgi:hypothetical protein
MPGNHGIVTNNFKSELRNMNNNERKSKDITGSWLSTTGILGEQLSKDPFPDMN